MNKLLLTSPINSITNRISSHRSAQAVIYANMIENTLDKVVDIDYGNKIEDYSQYDIMAVYHGNDFSGGLNIFGGLANIETAKQIAKFSNFPGQVVSIGIDFPAYGDMIQDRITAARAKNKPVPQQWLDINFANLAKWASQNPMLSTWKIISDTPKLIVGDSHATSLYRPGWMLNSVPFKTLNGVLLDGLEKYTEVGGFSHIEEIEFYFGNIDIRHHLCRISDNHEKNTRELVLRYIEAVNKIDVAKKSIYIPLPIENESRKLPKSGYYKGKPFYGTWAERNNVRNIFIQTLKENSAGINVVDWTSHLMNDIGELDFRCMEKPQSVHLSREFYPYWQGKTENSDKHVLF